MTETIIDRDLAAPVAVTTDSKVLPKRNGHRGMLPSTWTGRSLRLEYTDANGKGQKTSATLLDYCGVGVVLSAHGARMIVPWERLALIELIAD